MSNPLLEVLNDKTMLDDRRQLVVRMHPDSWPKLLDLEIVEEFPQRTVTTIHGPPLVEMLSPAPAYLVRGHGGFAVAAVRQSETQLIAYVFSATGEADARALIDTAFPPASAQNPS